jgi:hypothetical protein
MTQGTFKAHSLARVAGGVGVGNVVANGLQGGRIGVQCAHANGE